MPNEQTPATSVLQTLAIPISIVVAGGLIAVAVFMSGGGSSQGQTGVPQPQVDIANVKIEADDPVIGNSNAPVTLAYWFDYQCPFCKAVDTGGVEGIPIEPSIPTLIKEYVETGKLRIVFKDYAFLGDDSTTAALYKHAVWELYPDKFYEWHETMFEAQDEEHGGFGDEPSILSLIRKIPGLDADRLKKQVADKRDEYLTLIQADQTEAAGFGIGGTPGFITGKTLIPGAEQLSTFKAAIDAQL